MYIRVHCIYEYSITKADLMTTVDYYTIDGSLRWQSCDDWQ
jgi:hypothetical protein